MKLLTVANLALDDKRSSRRVRSNERQHTANRQGTGHWQYTRLVVHETVDRGMYGVERSKGSKHHQIKKSFCHDV
jgi:hypothetical protein